MVVVRAVIVAGAFVAVVIAQISLLNIVVAAITFVYPAVVVAGAVTVLLAASNRAVRSRI